MPTFDAHKNFVTTTVSNSPGTAGTTLTVATGTGATFPATPFNCAIFPSGIFPNILNSEIVRVTAISTDSLTITRQQESTTARNIIAGDIIALTVTSKVLQDIETAISAITSSSYPDITDIGGNVGINTTTPNYTLDVNGTMQAEQVGAQVFYDSTYNSFLIYDPTQFVGSPSYVNGNGGNFGIGTNNPQYNLDVNGFIGNSANGGDISVAAGITNGYGDSSYFHLDGYSGNSWLNSNGGNFGIGTNNPQYTLDVNGRIANSIGDLIIQGGIDNETPELGIPADLYLNADCGGNNVYIGDAGKIYLGGGGATVDCNLGNIYNIGAYKLTGGDSNSYVGCNGGYVGIGTTTPNYTLDVNGGIGNSAYGNINYLQLDDGYGNTTLQIQTGALVVFTATGGFIVESNGDIADNNETYYIGTNGNNSYLNYNGGNFGIGTSTPNYTLDVNGVIGNSLTNDYYIGVNFESSYLNSNGGYVGIGTSTPYYELDVSGDINFTGNLFYNGGQNWISSDGYGNTYFNTSLGNGGIIAQSFTSVQAFFQVISTTQHVALVTDPLVNGEYSFGIQDFNNGVPLVIGCLPNGNVSVPNNLGVGTSTPNYTLDVSGDINFTGNLYYNGGQNWISSDGDGNTYFNTSLGNGGIVAQSDSSVQAFIQVISTTQHVALVTDPLVNGEYSFGIYDFNYGGLVIGCLPNGNASVPNNLGVGTSTPDYTLDVAGTGNISSNVTIGGTLSVVNLLVVPQLSTSTATSGTVSMLNTGYQNTLYLSSSSTITSITIALPTTTVIGQTYTLHSKSIVTTLSVTGGSFSDAAVTSLIAGQTIKYQATSTGGAYIRVQ